MLSTEMVSTAEKGHLMLAITKAKGIIYDCLFIGNFSLEKIFYIQHILNIDSFCKWIA